MADACIRAGVAVRCVSLRPVVPGTRVSGRVLPARHAGSVDIFLEAIEVHAVPGDVLVVDNGGRLDEACVGDLIALEARAAGLNGIVIWGLHRDTADIKSIGLPVFSLGSIPAGPRSLGDRTDDALQLAKMGEWTVTRADIVVADDDGVLFIPSDVARDIVALADEIRDTEHRQAERIRSGTPLRSQLQFPAYLAARAQDPAFTFRTHLRSISAAIEE
ncbi:MAG: RraA family protein [Streptosporangiaceae bacterium]|nr:RraA family protein [Streptosporangiaceae bacterium]